MGDYISMKKLFSFCIIFIICGFLALSQNRTAEQPQLVTNITVLVSNMNVQLTWRRPAGVTYEPGMIFRIYRDTKPLTRQTIGPRTLVSEQDAGQMIYTETLPDTKGYYYAVIGLTDADSISYSLIPSVNATVTPAVGKYVSQTDSVMSDITDFNVISQENSVIITYISQNKGKKLILYRSATPFENFYSLNKAMKLAVFIDSGTPYTDYPPLNIKFYYALLEENDVISGDVDFKPGKNTSAAPVSVLGTSASTTKTRNIRQTPLPDLAPADSSRSGSLKQETLQMLPDNNTGITKAGHAELLSPYIFDEDTAENTELSHIIKNSFSKDNWALAEKDLTTLIKNTNDKKMTARAKFYLGEVYYFSGEKRMALLQFLSVRQDFPSTASQWIEAVLAQ